MRTPRTLWMTVAAVALALGLSARATAGGKKQEKYYFEVAKVELTKGIPAHVAERTRKQLAERIEAHDELLSALEGAPDPDKAPKKFKRYLKRHKLRAFKVNVEVTKYKHELRPMPAPGKGQRLEVSIDLRTFGETIPDRVMAFSGEGSATVILEIGKKLRKRDSEIGNHDAIELAIDKALAESIRKLRLPASKRKK